jgi:hypothetical protein
MVLFKKTWQIDGQDESTTITLTYSKEWDIRIDQCDTGATVERTYGDWDYEQWLIVKRANAPILLEIVLAYAFSQSDKLTLKKLKQMLEREGIKVEYGFWT